jgi:hypothetical protein
VIATEKRRVRFLGCLKASAVAVAAPVALPPNVRVYCIGDEGYVVDLHHLRRLRQQQKRPENCSRRLLDPRERPGLILQEG